MISRRDIDIDSFMEDMQQRGQSKKVTQIDQAMAIADEGGYWTEAFLSSAPVVAKKALLRQLFRHGFVDDDGNRREFLNIEETDPDTGEVRKGYKQFTFFSADNWAWAILDGRQRLDTEAERYRKICRMAVQACPEIQQRFDFPLPIEETAEV